MKKSLLKLHMVGLLFMVVILTACGGGGGDDDANPTPTPNPTYTVTYNGNNNTGGSVPAVSTNYEQGQTVTVPGNTGNLEKTGNSFTGWNTQADGTGTTYAQGQTLTIGSANLTLFAKWTSNPTYTVTYDGNGSTGGSVPIDSTNYEQGQTVTVIGNTGNIEKTGNFFAGWNAQADGTGTTYGQGQTITMVSANITLYAKWTSNPTYTVIYNGNSSTGGSVPVDSTNYEQGQTVTVPGNSGNLEKTGYTFAGWNTQADGTGTTYTEGQTFAMGAANISLYAKWTADPTYIVTYDGNGNTGGSVPTDSTNYEQGQTVTVHGNTGNLVKTGYFFAGWNTQAGGNGATYTQTQTFAMGSAYVTLYAKWNANPVLATVTTTAISSITGTTATSGGNVTADGGAAVTARGICWSTGIDPTISGSLTTDGTGTGSFISSMTGLTDNTTYYVRAYATNSVGTAYGTSRTFFATSSGHIFDANTVALWRLNEVSATENAADDTGGYNLTQFGGPDIIAGRIGNGRLLNGSSKFFQKQGDANLGTVLNGDWTYEGWVYLDPSFSAGANLFIYNGLWFSVNTQDTILAEVGVLSNRKIYWHQWQSTSSYTEISSNAVLQTGQFYHIAVSRSAQADNLLTYRLYVNGILDTVTSDVAGLSSAVPGDSHYIGLGCYTGGTGLGSGGNVLNGRLDDTRISKLARSDAEILESYRRGPIFKDNLDGTMTDKRTGLMWVKSPGSTRRDWQTSIDYSDALDFAGHTDWRAPTIDELTGLIDGWTGTDVMSWLTSQGFSNVQADRYWSSITYWYDGTAAYDLYMPSGHTDIVSKSVSTYVWPVRPGQ